MPISVANVQKVFTPDGKCTDPEIEARIRSVATMLVDYLRQAVCPRITLEKMLREGKAA
jgi:FMN reductase